MASTYTDAQKADAVAQVLEVGALTEVAKELGIPKSTLSGWLTPEQSSQLAERSEAKTAAATKAHTQRMTELRTKAQAEFAASALFAAKQVRSAEKGTDAQGWATAGGICLDKVRLEMGEATARTEFVDAPERSPDVEAELAAVVQLAERRAA